VRYIALNDNIDTMMDSNEIAPFKNVLNEMLSLRMVSYKAASADSFRKNRRCSRRAVHTSPVCHLISSFSFDKNTYRRIN
jgi:hypothetical protein